MTELLPFLATIFLLACLIAVDLRSAFVEYQAEGSALRLSLHCVFLVVLILLVINTLSFFLDWGFQIPYFDVVITSKHMTAS